MKVHLRKRKQSKKGQISLYLEIYKGYEKTPDGKTKVNRDYEYLDLYLHDKPKDDSERQHNKEHLGLAKSIKSQRELDIKKGQYGFTSTVKRKADFLKYFNMLAIDREDSGGNYGNWKSSIKHFTDFAGATKTFNEIDEKLCKGFLSYLVKKAKTSSNNNLSSSSVASYFGKYRACLAQAVKDKIIPSNPCDDLTMPKVEESKREYLTFEELKAIVKAECRYDVLKRAFIFSCLTGLRWSDIHKLKWSEVQQNQDGWKIVFHQKKTKGLQYLDLSSQAKEYLGPPAGSDDRVFIGLRYSSYMNVALQQWMMRAGIAKQITFHCARHTFAVLQLSLGTEIYTLSKLLGHSEIRTTQIYAQIIDAKKKEAVNKIPNISI
ncbi:MAG: site-specific integrase [Flavobacteriaceae bacterium]|nr:site-specific integrase [Flavobacteriaceae bacterium]